VHAYLSAATGRIGTIPSYFRANLALCQSIPPFDFYDAARPVLHNPRFLPASKLEQCTIHNALISEGRILQARNIDRAVMDPQPYRQECAHPYSLLNRRRQSYERFG